MISAATYEEPRVRPMMEVAAAAVGMILFALVVHEGWHSSALALVVVAATVGWSLREVASPLAVLGVGGLSREVIRFSLVGGLIGAAVGALHGHALGMSLWTAGSLEWFAPIACLIGAAEELVYRGWLLGRAWLLGWRAAVVIAAIAHAGYKTALFVLAPGSTAIELTGIFLWTLVGGVLLGLLRARSMNVIPAVFAHAAFDLVVYGGLVRAPWWVWG